jgi:hypothetical protein
MTAWSSVSLSKIAHLSERKIALARVKSTNIEESLGEVQPELLEAG